MKISYNWLKQFLETDWPAEKTGELLTDLGLEVEGIEAFESVQGGLRGVILGKVLNSEKHPNADRLKVCKVDVGAKEALQIVCGAPNVAEGQMVPVAMVGTTLYPAEGEPWTIKKGKIRGEESQGMICAEDELGLGTDHDGIMVLDTDKKPGTPCAEIFEIENDWVFEIGLTPNRADAMSHFGVARDLRAGLRQQEINKELITPSVSTFAVDNRSLKIDVSVADARLAPRYCGVTISNLIVQESPDWLKNRLRAIGLNPINNVVDATNYVLHELGQPLHAFDADRIFGNRIEVKTIAGGTTFMTLDGEERILHEDDLMICDGEKPMCIAGIFGGINTGVTEMTRNIFLESAYFDPVSIRKTAKRHGLSTDASFRFERGIDIDRVEYALLRAAILIRDLTGGDITSDVVDLYPQKFEGYNVFLPYEKINGLIGESIKRDTVISILASLDIQVKSVTESGLGLIIPSYRVDVRRDVDVVEEILRVYGYNNIPDQSQFTASIVPPSGPEAHRVQERVADRLAALGFYEILGNSLCNPMHNNLLGERPQQPVSLVNPLSNELSQLRQDLVFTGLGAIAHNLNRKQANLKLFEFGKIYGVVDQNRVEESRLSILLCGRSQREHWGMNPEPMSFFYLKGIVGQLLGSCGIENWTESALKDTRFSEALQLSRDKEILAELGVVSPSLRSAFDISQEVLYADIRWDKLLTTSRASGETSFEEIPKFPEVKRDFALLLDQQVPFAELYKLAFRTERKILRDVRLFDVYKGKNLPEDKKSYAVSFYLQAKDKTLKDKQIDQAMNRLQKAFEKELGAELR